MGSTVKHYQDKETGLIHAFEDDYDPFTANNRNIPATLTQAIKQKPTESHVWYHGDWIRQEDAPDGYIVPISNVPSYNPAWMAYLFPYTAVHRTETSGLNISLEEINANSYDGNKLAEAVAILPIGTRSGIPAFISYDGAIAIPQCEDFPNNADGVSKLNEILCSLLLGGVHTEVLHSNGLAVGSLQDKTRLFAYTPSLHTQLRLNWAAINDRLLPLMHPRVLMAQKIIAAYDQGQKVIRVIHNLSPFFLLNGYTAMVYRNKNDALNNLWVVVEQITMHLWTEHYEKNKNAYPARIARCHTRLKKHPGLDKISAKHKLLRLAKIISKDCCRALYDARKERNALAHSGVVPDYQTIYVLWKALPELIEVASGIGVPGMKGLHGVPANLGIPKKANFDEWIELASQL
jgi:hypothetical protein